jgi:16S rRNA (uracil1498-N3)-methyltransferase
MGSGHVPSDLSELRSIPRAFVPDASATEEFELPAEELDKFRKVLRLGTGDEVAILPGDGSLIVCRLDGRRAVPLQVLHPKTESQFALTIAQALPKGDKLDEIVRACTSFGVSGFLLFHSDRTVVRWDDEKFAAKVKRLEAIAREAAEVSFRTRLPAFEVAPNLESALKAAPDAIVLSESQSVTKGLVKKSSPMTVVVGPEGGWSPREFEVIGNRGVTLGPRVLRVDHAAPAAAAMLLLSQAEV